MKVLLQYLTEQGKCSDDERFLTLLMEGAPQYEEAMTTLAQRLEQKSRQKILQETAIKMLEEHLSTDLITSVTGLTREKIISLAENLNLQLKPTIQ